jgi:hypothetical protein
MKTFIWSLIFLAALTPVLLYFFRRWQQKQAEKNGVVVYATVVSIAAVKRFGKELPVKKITMWLQEPGKERRTVILQTQIPAGQSIVAGMMIPVAVDPKKPERVFPAGEDAVKRLVLTGPRRDRRQMKKQRPGSRG